MLDNFYDKENFFNNYKQIRDDANNANDKIEMPYFQKLLPSVKDKVVLDLGCGMGSYVLQMASGARQIDAVDISKKMLHVLRDELEQRNIRNVNVIHGPLEKYKFKDNYYDLVISTLAFHYVSDLKTLFESINNCLKKDGMFIFSVEHPVLTATKDIGWEVDKSGDYVYWRLDNYFETGGRSYEWLGSMVTKYHRTFEDYYHLLVDNDFKILDLKEPKPKSEERALDKELDGHYRRPIILMFSARKS